MSVLGRTELHEFQAYAIVAFAVAAAACDLRWKRIFNWLTLPMMVSGVVAAPVFGGWNALAGSVLGALCGLMLYGWLFWVGAMGGGDVKFLMGIGAWGGVAYAVEVALLGIVLGGAMAVGILLVKGRLLSFVQRMYRFLLTVFVKELEVESPKLDPKLKMLFGVPIAASAIWAALGHPLRDLGVSLW